MSQGEAVEKRLAIRADAGSCSWSPKTDFADVQSATWVSVQARPERCFTCVPFEAVPSLVKTFAASLAL